MANECNIEKNMEHCTCTFSCSRKGKCCECVVYHRNHGEIPGCFFPKNEEKTGDRSVGNFVTIFKKLIK